MEAVPTTLSEAKRSAGDFASLGDYCVIEITSGGDWKHSWTKRRVAREWKLATSEAWYAEAVCE